MNIEEAINLIFSGNCVLFLGAGYSYQAENALKNGIPMAGDLAGLLDKESGEDSEGDLSLAAESYIEAKGEYQIVEFLKDTFAAVSVKDCQEELGKYSWKRVYTTNYDNVFESSVIKNKKRATSITLTDKLRDFKDKKGLVIHLNGSISNLTTCELSAEFKLTDSSYLTSEFLQSEWLTLFRNDLADADAVFFVGFSGKTDLDIKRVLFETESLKQKTFFITQNNESKATVKRLKQFGCVCNIGRDGFAEKIRLQKNSYVPPVMKLERPFLSFKKADFPSSRKELHDEDINKLFLYGEVDSKILYYSVFEPEQYLYYVKRDKLDATISEITNGRKHILIHSDAGNGKTLFLDGLSMQLIKKGYDVYNFCKYSVRMNEEVERICSIKSHKVVIIIEDYASNSDVLDAIKLYSTDQIIVFSERSVRNDMKYQSLITSFGDDFYSVDLNYLSNVEVGVLVDIFNHYGLWQEFSTFREDKKRDFFKTKCGNSFRGILLALFRSPSIKSRLKQIVFGIQNETNYYEAVVVALLNKVYSLNLDLDMLSDALGGGYNGDYTFKKSTLINEFLDFKNNEIKVKSSILAEVLLWDILDVLSSKNVLVKMFKNFDKKRNSRQYSRALQLLLSYTTLQRVLNKEDNNFNHAMRGFFEEIRETKFCKNNPHYWLQYAIRKLDEHDYNAARIYFENAFAYAKAKDGFDSYQIKNHYARYLLENAVNSDTLLDNYMEIFKEAHNIVIDPFHLSENKYYPFRVARNYLPFYKQYKVRMNVHEKKYIQEACMKVLQMIDKFYIANPRYKGRKDVKEAKIYLSQIVADN